MVPRRNEGPPFPHAPLAPPPPLIKHHHSTRSSFSGHSNEADDERSYSSSTSPFSMGPVGADAADDGVPPPSYPGEDTRPTSKRELLGFYAYSWAAEVYPVCGLGAFIPITLEELARASPSAVQADDRSLPCRSRGIERALLLPRLDRPEAAQCVFRFLGAEINTASFAMYTFSLSVLLQAVVVVTMSGAADHGRYRKTLMLGFAVIGSVTTMLFLPVVPSVAWLGSIWTIIGNVGFGASFVLLNSFLPLMVRNHPEARAAAMERYEQVSTIDEDLDPADDSPSYDSPMVDTVTSHLTEPVTFPLSPAASYPEIQLSTQISSYGVGIGYSAAVVVQIISIVLLKAMGASLLSLRLVLLVIGVWWLCFTLPAALWLRPRPGPPLALDESGNPFTWFGYLTYSWKNLGSTMLRARRLRDVLLFLAAWFMISDAIATVSGTAILFAKTTLGMDASALAMINVIVTICGIVGALTWSKVSRLMQWEPSHTILTCICLFEVIPVYGLLGYVPAIQRFGSFGLQQQWEMYPLGAVYGLVLGGLSSYCRSLFGELIPPGSEAAFYALFAITDKGSSVFGPAVVGAITDATGDIRPAFWFLAVLIGLPIPLMLLVDVERGKREGARLAQETTVSLVGGGSIADDEDEAIPEDEVE